MGAAGACSSCGFSACGAGCGGFVAPDALACQKCGWRVGEASPAVAFGASDVKHLSPRAGVIALVLFILVLLVLMVTLGGGF